MKHIDTWITETDYKAFKRIVEKLGATDYLLAQHAITKYIYQRQDRQLGMNIAFWFLCYALSVTAILVLFSFA